MARQTEVGIKITAVSTGLQKGVKTAVKGLQGLRKGLALTGKGVEGFGSTYKSGIDVIFKSVEVFKSVQGLITDTVGKFVEASIKFRREGTDPQIKAIKKFRREADRTMGAFGDIFVQVYAGVAKSLRPTVKSLRTFLKANREIIGTKIVEFLVKLSTTFLNVLGPAVNMAYKIFSGFKNILTLGEAAVAGYTSAVEELYAAIASEQATDAYQQLNDQEKKIIEIRQERFRVFSETNSKETEEYKAITARLNAEIKKRDELKFTYEKQSLAAENAKASADKASKASQRAQANAAKEILQQEKNVKELEKTIERVTKAIESGISEVALSALAELRKDVKSYATTQEEANKAEEKRKATLAAALARFRAREEAERAKAAEREKQRMEEMKALAMSAGQAVLNNFDTAFTGMINGTKKAGEAFRDLANGIIADLLRIAAQQALTAFIGTLFSGGFGGTAFGGAFTGAGFLGNLIEGPMQPGGGGAGPVYAPNMGRKPFNSGGYVKGFASGGGVDSVRALLSPGEYVLPKGLVDSIRLGKAPPKAVYANGGLVSQSASLPAQQVNVTMSTFAVPSKAEFRRWYKSTVVPNRRKMGKRGQLE